MVGLTMATKACACNRVLKGLWSNPVMSKYFINEINTEIYRSIYNRAQKKECRGCLEVIDAHCTINLLLFLQDIGIKEIIELNKWCWAFDDIIKAQTKNRWKK